MQNPSRKRRVFALSGFTLKEMSALLPLLVPILLACVVLQFVFLAGMQRHMARQTKMLRQFFSGPQGEDLEGLLTRTLDESKSANEAALAAQSQITELMTRFQGCVQHFALVRYDAFEDVTGGLSFSLAMLDGRSNGAIISTIFGRTNSRCFGKMIVDGRPEQPLTDEEQNALLQALESKVGGKTASESFGSKKSVFLEEPKRELVGAGRE